MMNEINICFRYVIAIVASIAISTSSRAESTASPHSLEFLDELPVEWGSQREEDVLWPGKDRGVGLSSFDYLCRSIDCVLKGSKRIDKIDTTSGTAFAAPYKMFVDLPRELFKSEFERDFMASWDGRDGNIVADTQYAYAFVPKEFVENFDEERLIKFNQDTTSSNFHTIAVTISNSTDKGLAICRFVRGRHKVIASVPVSCIIARLQSDGQTLYRVIVGRPEPLGTNPFAVERFATKWEPKSKPVDELNRDGATPSFDYRSNVGFRVDSHCLNVWPELLAAELEINEKIRFSRREFGLSKASNMVLISGETLERRSPIEGNKWEIVTGSIKLERSEKEQFYLDVLLAAYTAPAKPPDQIETKGYHDSYYSEISNLVRETHDRVCK
jgi:hypothetical protein